MSRTLTIIGGGIAGLGLANGLVQRGVPVRVLEAGSYPRHRVCGEFMTSLNNELIENLAIGDCLLDAVIHRTTGWFRKGVLIRRYTLPEPALGISRYRLDALMAEAFQSAGGQLEERTRTDTTPREGYLLATGRKPVSGGWTGLKGHWHGLELQTDLEVHLGRGSYVGLSLVEDGFVNVCGLFGEIASGSFSSPLERFMETLRQTGLSQLCQRLQEARFREGSFCSVTGLIYGQAGTSGLGDAWRQIPPFTGHGMTLALEAAAITLPLAEKWSRGELDWDELEQKQQQQMTRSLGSRYRAACLLHPFLTRPSLQTILQKLAFAGWLPFRPFYQLTHT